MAEGIEGKGLSNIVIVNKLLKETFGRSTKGTYKYLRPLPLPCFKEDGKYIIDPLRLKIILKKSLFGRNIVIGHFSEEDGSHLILDGRDSRYVPNAKKCARLYEESFRRKAIIEHNGKRF